MSAKLIQGTLVGETLGKYKLLALLAVGGTAEIYLARIDGEAGFEKYVVVKSLLDHLADDPDYVQMFLDEARLGAQLDHSNIVQTLELGEQKGRYYMAMEYLAGMSLAQLARKTNQRVTGGKIPVELVLGLAAQTCAGLHYAHRKPTASGHPLNLVHRDISPQNLVVSFDGILKIVDFGIAKADVRDTHTQSGTIKGKFAYMSPEQCQAQKIDHRTDIFALGVILHELLTVRRLFKRTTTYETYEAIIKGNVPTPSSLNSSLGPEIDEVVMKALAYRKEDRYESAEGLGQALLSTLHKRSQVVNASDIAQFYSQHFGPEIKEHQERMRQLITGKRESVADDESINWEIDDIPSDNSDDASVSNVDGSMIEEINPIGDGPEPVMADATRVEVNPLNLMAQLSPIGSRHSKTPARKSQELAANKTIAPGGIAPLPRASSQHEQPDAKQSIQTSGPSAKTIFPGQMMATSPELLEAVADRQKELAQERPSNLGRAEAQPSPSVRAASASSLSSQSPQPQPSQSSADNKPRKTVMGVAIAKPVPATGGQRAAATSNKGAHRNPHSDTDESRKTIERTAQVNSSAPVTASAGARTLYNSPPATSGIDQPTNRLPTAVPNVPATVASPTTGPQAAAPPKTLSSEGGHSLRAQGARSPNYNYAHAPGNVRHPLSQPAPVPHHLNPYPPTTRLRQNNRRSILIAFVFVLSVGLGLGVTLLINSLS